MDGDRNARLQLRWQEKCTRDIKGPDGKDGFGTRLIERTVNYELGGNVNTQYEREGIICTIETPWNNGIGGIA